MKKIFMFLIIGILFVSLVAGGLVISEIVVDIIQEDRDALITKGITDLNVTTYQKGNSTLIINMKKQGIFENIRSISLLKPVCSKVGNHNSCSLQLKNQTQIDLEVKEIVQETLKEAGKTPINDLAVLDTKIVVIDNKIISEEIIG